MVISVPVLSASGSWFCAAVYVNPLAAIPVTVNVAELPRLRMLLDTIEHLPFALVVQVPVPLALLLQFPFTVAPATGW